MSVSLSAPGSIPVDTAVPLAATGCVVATVSAALVSGPAVSEVAEELRARRNGPLRFWHWE